MPTVETPLGAKVSTYCPHWPHPPQEAFLWLDNLEALYGGAAGGGKSDALLMGALEYVDVPGYAALLLRKTYADLALPGAIMDRSKSWLMGTDASWNDNTKQWTFPSGATITFGYLQNQNDKFRYQGAEFQYVGFDELTQFEEPDYAYLLSRLRRPADGPLSMVPLRMRSASNPGGRGHKWVKRRLIDRQPDPDDPEDTPEKCAGRVFIPSKLDDNPSVDQEAYAASLMGLDPQTRLQLLNGDWNARQPGDWVFPKGLDSVFALGAKHREMRANGQMPEPVGGHLLLAADWGVNSHILVLWPLEAGGFHVAAEVVYHGDSVWDTAPKVVGHLDRLGWPVAEERFDASMPGLNAAFLKALHEHEQIGRVKFAAVPFSKFKALSADYLRLLVHNTHTGQVAPVLSVDEQACPVLAEQMQGMSYSDPDAGKIEKGDDHGFDALIAGVAPDAARRTRKTQ